MRDRVVAHKDYDVRGGSEIVAERLAESFDCPLYVGHGTNDKQPDDLNIDVRQIKPDSRWHNLMKRSGLLRSIGHMMHWRDSAPEALADYDTVITSGNEPLWFMPRDHQTVVAYTHSTPRFMYDLNHTSDGFFGRSFQQIQRRLYEGAIKRPDLWIANSDLVARRINLYWNVPIEQIRIVYPPVATGEFNPDDLPTQDYYLVLGRLAAHKQVNQVIQAFNDSKFRLRIAGDGPKKAELRNQAGANVRFEGYVSAQEKRELLAGAKAVIYPPQNEDFGMVPIEAMASGTPVIGVNEGFTQYQIQDSKNGILWDRSVENLRDAINAFENVGVEWSTDEIATWAEDNFGVGRFNEQICALVELAEERTDIEPAWTMPGDDMGRLEKQKPVKADGGDNDGK